MKNLHGRSYIEDRIEDDYSKGVRFVLEFPKIKHFFSKAGMMDYSEDDSIIFNRINLPIKGRLKRFTQIGDLRISDELLLELTDLQIILSFDERLSDLLRKLKDKKLEKGDYVFKKGRIKGAV